MPLTGNGYSLRGAPKVKMMRSMVDPRAMSDDQLAVEARALIEQDKIAATRWMCDRPNCDGLPHRGWRHNHARAEQRPPKWQWAEWLILTGRGFGKTRAGAETCRWWGTQKPMHIAVIGETHQKVKEICFEHPSSGLCSVIPQNQQRHYSKGIGMVSLTLTNGTVFRSFSAQQPDAPRGYAFDKAWMDEYAAMGIRLAQETYDNVWFALREAVEPQVILTTTPKPLPHVRALVEKHREQIKLTEKPLTAITTGSMRDNLANLSELAVQRLEESYEGTRLGRQELSGELLEDHPGALWELWMYEVDGFRPDPIGIPQMSRKVLAIDPAVTSGEQSDQTAIVIAGRDYGLSWLAPKDERPRGYVLHAEQARALPQETMKRVAKLFWEHKCDVVVIEANNGGDWIPAVLQMTDDRIPFQIVHAKDGKRTRARPISSLYEQMRIHHVGPVRMFSELEKQQTTWTDDPNEDSPDLMDACVWALWSLFIDPKDPPQRMASHDRRLAGRR
jgi:predicted phage terminase large subunit-like protein